MSFMLYFAEGFLQISSLDTCGTISLWCCRIWPLFSKSSLSQNSEI